MVQVQFNETSKVLRQYGERVAAAYRERMRGSGHITMSPDTLINGVEVIVDREGLGVISVALRLAEYWKYVEWDTRPHFPPVAAIQRWVEVKPIVPRPDSRGRIPRPASIAFMIARKIAEEGTKGTHDLAEAVEAMNRAYLPAIRAAVAKDIGAATRAEISLLFGKGSK